jgi:formylglycine-generating enzyme
MAKISGLSTPGEWKINQMGRIVLFYLMVVVLASCGRKNSIPRNDTDELNTVFIKGGKFLAFNDSAFLVNIPNLEVMKYEVTNHSFELFVEATGYQTTAQIQHEGMVFDRKAKSWNLVKDADWRNPQGRGSSIDGNESHPVVQVSQRDACAYCEWLGMRLPTEVEWEYIYQLDLQEPAREKNIWQGVFPHEDKGEDGFRGTSPVGSFGQGATGCCDLQGNVWERCSDFYHSQWPIVGRDLSDSAKYYGPPVSFSELILYDTLRVIKGGSFLCADNYCRGYESNARMGSDPTMGYEHIGFRCVREKK